MKILYSTNKIKVKVDDGIRYFLGYFNILEEALQARGPGIHE